MAGGHDDEE